MGEEDEGERGAGGDGRLRASSMAFAERVNGCGRIAVPFAVIVLTWLSATRTPWMYQLGVKQLFPVNISRWGGHRWDIC